MQKFPLAFAAWLIASPVLAQTQEFLEAPTVKDLLRVRYSPGQKKMQYAIDDGATFREIRSDALFLTRESIYLTYPNLNPLRFQPSTSVKAVDDPTHDTIKKLIESVLSVVPLVAPGAPPVPSASIAPRCYNTGFDQLLRTDDLGARKVTAMVQSWITKIDLGFTNDSGGPSAIAAGATAIKGDADKIRDVNTAADNQLKIFDTCLQTVGDQTARSNHLTYRFAVTEVLKQRKALVAVIDQLRSSLNKTYSDSQSWVGPNDSDFVISTEIRPTASKMQVVTVKVASVDIRADPVSGALSVGGSEVGTAELTVRSFSPFATEVGVGAVFGTLTTLKYGTSMNDEGETVVGEPTESETSISPTIMVNFVCRCGAKRFSPMFQIGVAASKDLPALLFGGGIRLFGMGSGDIALGGGLMLGWIKDLQKLEVDDPVGGSADIDADLAFRSTPDQGGYFVIQYTF